jgi:hypothetical protein
MKDIGELFEVVIEPEGSTLRIIELENKYQINTSSFIDCYVQKILKDSKEFDYWHYLYTIFIASNGDESKINKW